MKAPKSIPEPALDIAQAKLSAVRFMLDELDNVFDAFDCIESLLTGMTRPGLGSDHMNEIDPGELSCLIRIVNLHGKELVEGWREDHASA